MYVVRWMGSGPKQTEYLAYMAPNFSRAHWDGLKEAKLFESEAEAERYITDEAGYRYWKENAVVMFMHPLNVQA